MSSKDEKVNNEEDLDNYTKYSNAKANVEIFPSNLIFLLCRVVVSIHAMFRCPNEGLTVSFNRGLSRHGVRFRWNVDRYKRLVEFQLFELFVSLLPETT